LRRERIDAAYASDLERAVMTAGLALADREIPLIPEPRLRELAFGEWEGLTFAEIQAGWPGSDGLLRLGPDFCAPGGEPFARHRERIVEAAEEILARHKDDTVLIVAHGGTLQVLLQRALDLPDTSLFRLATHNCGLTVVEVDGEYIAVTRVNDCAHLEPRRRRVRETE
jgi:alpha-ribazole phosphatase